MSRRTALFGAVLSLVAAGMVPAFAVGPTGRAAITVAGAGADGAQAEAWRPDPPTVLLSAHSDTGLTGDATTSDRDPEVVVTAPGGAAAYRVLLYLDDARQPFASRLVHPGQGLGFSAGTGHLADGVHSVRAVAVPASAAASGAGEVVGRALSLTVLTGPVEGRAITLGGNADGRAGAGDHVTVEFSRPLLPASICPDWGDVPGRAYRLEHVLATLSPGLAGSGATLTVAAAPGGCGSMQGRISLGSVTVNAGYLPGAATPAGAQPLRFAGSTLELGPDWSTLTLTLGNLRTPGAPAGATVQAPRAGQARPVFTPAVPGPTDVAGDPLDPTAFADPEASGF